MLSINSYCARCEFVISMLTEEEKEKYRKQTTASHPGLAELSIEKLRIMRPDLFGILGFVQKILVKINFFGDQIASLRRHLLLGDTRAAIVVSTSPLLIAAYTDELDCVAMLKFPERVLTQFNLEVKQRLVTINLYSKETDEGTDLTFGTRNKGNWTSFCPLIGDFLTDDEEQINLRKSQIREGEWERTWKLAQEYLKEKPNLFRDGLPFWCNFDAKIVEEDE